MDIDRGLQVVRSKKGLLWGLLTVSFSVWFFFTSVPLLDATFDKGAYNIPAMVAVQLVFALMFLHILTETVLITPEYISVRSLIYRHKIHWRDAEEIWVAPFLGNTILFGYNLWIRVPKKPYFQRLIPLNASLYANSHELSKAALEAADRANPALHIVGSVLDTYGHPPYGIFKSKESL